MIKKKRPFIKNGLRISVIVMIMAGLVACGENNSSHPSKAGSAIELMHVHGLGYSPDGSEVMIPAHNGLAVFKEGKWSVAQVPAHDYMGFTMVDNGFYSSGHPAPDSDLKNPLGIVKSTDHGKTLEKLGLYGETDFHVMGVGYHNHTIYVYNEKPNSKMDQGLYVSNDDAKTWKKSDMQGVIGDLSVIAVHPTKNNVVAIGTSNGLFISEDAGNTFKSIETGTQITSLFYTYDDDQLLVGGWDGKASIVYSLKQSKKEQLNLPSIGKDSVAYMASNPKNPKEMMIATLKKSIYVSNDGGKQWILLIDNGTEVKS